ncbi:MAG: hypothetical protein SGI73_21100 [Chloroflexota bacterium]|nr:hypothetical protein [Chloroflexota bacterium]
MFSLTQSLLNGVLLSLIFGLMVVGSLRWNPRLWIQDYPAAIRATQPPLTAQEQRQRAVLSGLILLIALGLPVLFVAQLRAADDGTLTFGAAYLFLWISLQMVNLFDAVIIDWVWLVMFHPKFVILPGAEGLAHLLEDKRMHLTNYAKGVVIFSVLALPFALAAVV